MQDDTEVRDGQCDSGGALSALRSAEFAVVPAFSRDLSRDDSASDSWINFSARAIKMTVFVLSSLILWRKRSISFKYCDLATTPTLVTSRPASDADQIAQETDATAARRRDV